MRICREKSRAGSPRHDKFTSSLESCSRCVLILIKFAHLLPFNDGLPITKVSEFAAPKEHLRA